MKIELLLTDLEVSLLKNDLLDPALWVQAAVAGKLNKCKKRLLHEWQPKLLADPAITSLPATEAGLLELILAHPDYKDRAARDAEQSL